ncbi:MAG: FliA/WhiG family RNA polymerase sigma factor [Chthonomonas sp.]|nr:FliA/WhiG family RNA polymerase sigma factor [Chthonomonas sp.]
MPLNPEKLKRVWIEYSVYHDPEARSELINHYSYLVKLVVGGLAASLPGGLDREDLVGSGVIGLIKSVDQFDPTRDVKFETYAIALIRGAILEMLRDEDWVPRSIREMLKAMDRAQMALEGRFGRPATEHEIAEYMGISDSAVSELLVRLGRTNVHIHDKDLSTGDSDYHIHFVDMNVDDRANSTGETKGREVHRLLNRGMDRLPERERLIVALYYFEGLTFKEIGKVLGVSVSRVYQLHTQAMTRLRGIVAESEPDAEAQWSQKYHPHFQAARQTTKPGISRTLSKTIIEQIGTRDATRQTNYGVALEEKMCLKHAIFLRGGMEHNYEIVAQALMQLLTAVGMELES